MGSLLLALIYLCFISLGLPDSLLGSSWPVLHTEINVPESFAGIISITIFIGTILSSLLSDRMLKKFGAGRVTAISTLMTAVALFGFSVSTKFWMVLLWSVPYGLGAGGVDAILNNYVALHFKAQHMSWLHCMWGVGASISPYIMSFSLVNLDNWSFGYLIVSIIQVIISIIVFISVPVWKKGEENSPAVSEPTTAEPLSFKEIFSTKGAIACFITFFAYCAFELTASLWASSYLVDVWSLEPEIAAGFASMFYIGITVGRFANGFLAMRVGDHTLIRTGIAIIGVGVVLMFLPHHIFALVGFAIIGLGCAPVYPCIIHMTPNVFGEDKSQAMIGVQMAFASLGFLTMPSLFGVIAENISISLLPIYLAILLIVMLINHELVAQKKRRKQIE